ncbi:MAG TPA: VOC family protein [Myxococcaceae bacterium]|nr:VOC family protein [Myxococcaceae bacterium]
MSRPSLRLLSVILAFIAAACVGSRPKPPPAPPEFLAPVSAESALGRVKAYAVTLSVPNVEEAAAWYVSKLGLREVKRKDYSLFGTRLVFLELNGWRVELIEDAKSQPGPAPAAPPAHTRVQGVSQFAFETRALAAVRGELEARGVPVVWEYESGDLGVRFLFIRDNNGNLIQFVERLLGP